MANPPCKRQAAAAAACPEPAEPPITPTPRARGIRGDHTILFKLGSSNLRAYKAQINADVLLKQY